MKKFYTAIILVSLILGACTSVEDSVSADPKQYWKGEASVDKPIDPTQIQTQEILKEPDVAIGAEKMYNGQELELSDVMDIALENNTQTRIYWFQAKVYAAQKGKAEAAYFPQISVGAQVYRGKYKSQYYPELGSYYETGYGPSAEINWLLYDFGKREANVDLTKEALRAANFDYNQVLQDVVLQVNVAYYQLYAAMNNKKAAILNLEDAKTAYEAANLMLSQNVGNKQDMLNALANAKNAEFTVQSTIAQEQKARADLAKVMGVKVDKTLKISDKVVLPTSDTTSKKVDDLIAIAMKSRQDLLAAYANLSKEKLAVEVAKKDYMPELSAYGQFSYTDFSNDILGEEYGYVGGLALSWSVFEGFQRHYEIVSAKAKLRMQAQTLKQTEIDIISSIWTYYWTYQSAQGQVVSTKAAETASIEAYEATKEGYENGVNTINDLLNAQTRLAQARTQKISAESNLAISIAQLAHSTGQFIASTNVIEGQAPSIKSDAKEDK